MFISGKEFIKEKLEKQAPKGTRFDWESYNKDIENGIGVMEQLRKCECGGYVTTKPAPLQWYELPMDTVVDKERYEHDKKIHGEFIADMWRKSGMYRRKE